MKFQNIPGKEERGRERSKQELRCEPEVEAAGRRGRGKFLGALKIDLL